VLSAGISSQFEPLLQRQFIKACAPVVKPMKTILIPSEDHDAMPAVLEAARLVARKFDSYIEGFAVRPSLGTYVTVEPVSGMAISSGFDGDTAKLVRSEFMAFMASHGVPQATSAEGPATFSYDWPREAYAEDDFIGSHGRFFDLIVLGRPGPEAKNARMPPFEAALFESGKPALLVPTAVPQSLGRNVLIAWNDSTEQAHTNALALPLLRLADEVTVLTVEGGSATPASCKAAALHLRRNGVKASASIVKSRAHQSGEATGEITLEYADKLGCDLLVKSAYTQSRLRQMIFGGATRHILGNATLPIFMAH
jgi:nucleotide-binding universal stress UspA family protein